jgi:hypothetical protein
VLLVPVFVVAVPTVERVGVVHVPPNPQLGGVAEKFVFSCTVVPGQIDGFTGVTFNVPLLTLMETLAVAEQPAAFEAVTVYVLLEVGVAIGLLMFVALSPVPGDQA